MENHTRLLIVFFGAIFLLTSCEQEVLEQEIIRPVRYIQVSSSGGTLVRTFSGVAQSGTESRISFKVPGTVREISVGVGDSVRDGQLMAELDSYEYQLKVEQAEAALAQARAQARNAEASYERVRNLYEKRSSSKSDLDAARTASESTRAAAQTAEKQLAYAQQQLSYTKLTAPASGAIANVMVEVNENIQAGLPVFLLVSGSQIEVSISIPEIMISQIKKNQAVKVRFDAVPEKEFEAFVAEIGIKAGGMATTFPVTIRLNQTDPAIRAGMVATAEFRFKSQDERERYIVPSEAVGEDRDGRFVFCVEHLPEEKGYGIIRRKSVVVGELTAGGMEIFKGLTDGDLVVTAGISHISDGQKVKL